MKIISVNPSGHARIELGKAACIMASNGDMLTYCDIKALSNQLAHYKPVRASCFCCALEEDKTALFAFSKAVFEAYFAERRNLDDIDELVRIAESWGLDGAALAFEALHDGNKHRLRENAHEPIELGALGALGSPIFFVDQTLKYFGTDQLPLSCRRIEASPTTESQSI
jgi:predicted DsbA family dithiol-disulfide isomerase